MNLCQRRQTTDADMSDDLRKRQLRRDAIARRKTVTRQERDAAAAALAEHIVPLLDLVGVQAGTSGVMSAPHGRGHRPPTVAAYVSMGSEIPMRPLLSLLLDRGLRVLVPRLGSGLDVGWALLPDMVSLHGVTCEGTGMAQRPDEPDTQTLGPAALGDADLIIVPALAVDAQQRGGELLQQPERRRTIVDEDPVAPLAPDLAAHHQVVFRAPARCLHDPQRIGKVRGG